MVMSFHQNSGQNHSLLITNKSFENVTKFKFENNSNKSDLHA